MTGQLLGRRRIATRARAAVTTNWLDPRARAFRRRGPWVTRFRVDGRAYGGTAELMDDERVSDFLEAFPAAATVLELGSLEGAHSFSLARRGRRVLAIEGRAENIARARFVQAMLGVDGVTFALANLEHTDLRRFGRFDAVFCVGLLYHLPRPWELLERLPAVSPRLFLQTHYAAAATATRDGAAGRRYREFGLGDPLSGLSADSFWLTLPELTSALEANGYAVRVLRDEPGHPHGPIVTLAAELS